MEIVSITALNLARMELELDLHLQQVSEHPKKTQKIEIPNFKILNLIPKIRNSKSKIPSQQPKIAISNIQNPIPKTRNTKIQNPKSHPKNPKYRNPKSHLKNPKYRNSNSNIRNTQYTKILNPKYQNEIHNLNSRKHTGMGGRQMPVSDSSATRDDDHPARDGAAKSVENGKMEKGKI